MPPGKKKAAVQKRTSSNYATRGQRTAGSLVHANPTTSATSTRIPAQDQALGSTAISLAEEARQTSRHASSFRGECSSLRFKYIKFISAGIVEPLKELNDDLLKVDTAQDASPVDHVLDKLHDADAAELFACKSNPNDYDLSDHVIGPEELDQAIEVSVPEHESTQHKQTVFPGFFFDIGGKKTDSPTSTKRVVHITHDPDPYDSTSSEEVILFKGRGHPQKSNVSEITMSQIKTEICVVEEQIRHRPPTNSDIAMHQPAKVSQRPHGRTNRRRDRREAAGNDAELIADYIANMRESGEIVGVCQPDGRNSRDLGGPLSQTSLSEVEDVSNCDSELAAETQDFDNGTCSGGEINEETLASLLFSGHNPIMSDLRTEHAPDHKSRHKSAGEGFDFMDWERPSLRMKRKGKRARAEINFGVSDSETEQRLQAAWKNDRMKKSERKKDRERLRALGLLGQHEPEDLSIKYPTGMNILQISQELKCFLLNSRPSLILTPMDSHARKVVHEIAHKFHIKSKSIGKGDSRRPTLCKTGRTVTWSQTKFDQVFNQVQRRNFPRLGGKGKRGGSGSQSLLRSVGNSSNNAPASYRDGEIVGAAAPELGSNNRGHAMLEKMGWSSGTALGSEDNKGILQPISQTMKMSKAGLG